MNAVRSLRAAMDGDPVAMVALHKWLTIGWLVASLPIIVFLPNSVPFLVFVSVYAVVTGHWSSWQAARVEVRQETSEIKQDERDVKQDERDAATDAAG